MYILVLMIILVSMITAILTSVKYMDIFNPILLFIVPISIQYIIYLGFYSDYGLRKKTLVILILVIVAYMFGGYLCLSLHRRKVRIKNIEKLYFNKSMIQLFAAISFLGFVFSFFEMFNNGMNGTKDFFTNVRINEIYGDGKSFFTKYSAVFLFMTTLILLYDYLYKVKIQQIHNCKGWYRLGFFCCMLFFSPLFTVARTELLTYALSSICLINNFSNKKYHKGIMNFIKKYKYMFLLGCLLLFVFYFLGDLSGRSVTSDIKSKEFFLYRYTGYTLVTFDSFCIEMPSVNGILNILGPLPKLLRIAGIKVDHTAIVPSGTPYNVYGYMGEVYTSIGMFGLVVVTFLISYLVMLLYIYSRYRGGYYLIFYSTYIYTIVISFFAYQYANTLYIYLLILMLILKIDHNGKLTLKKVRGDALELY